MQIGFFLLNLGAINLSKMKTRLICLLLFASMQIIKPVQTYSQVSFTVYPCQDSLAVVNLIQDVLVDHFPSSHISNVTFAGNPLSVGSYEYGYFLGFESGEGVVISTGFATDAEQSNVCNSGANASVNVNGVSSDSDLNEIAGMNTYDGAIIEFDFIPLSNFCQLNYEYASEEYHDFVYSFNDVIGILVSGPGIDGIYSNDATNITTINDSVNVNVSNINIGQGEETCKDSPTACKNCEYLVDNNDNDMPGFYWFPFDAYTVPLNAMINLIPGETYHIKIGIADASDHIYDSAIFLEKHSFKTAKHSKQNNINNKIIK